MVLFSSRFLGVSRVFSGHDVRDLIRIRVITSPPGPGDGDLNPGSSSAVRADSGGYFLFVVWSGGT